jgi:hypothetical protein
LKYLSNKHFRKTYPTQKKKIRENKFRIVRAQNCYNFIFGKVLIFIATKAYFLKFKCKNLFYLIQEVLKLFLSTLKGIGEGLKPLSKIEKQAI